MKRPLLIVVVILAAVVVFFIANAWSGGGIDGLGGDPWTLVAMKEFGKEVRKEEIRGIQVQFTKNAVSWMIPTEKGLKKLDAEYKIDPSKKPKMIDLEQIFTEDLRVMPGIYEIESDVLLIAIGDRRPTDFSSRGGIVLAFKR